MIYYILGVFWAVVFALEFCAFKTMPAKVICVIGAVCCLVAPPIIRRFEKKRL